jgi:hypothetical protein
MQLFIVGGAVRDQLLGRAAADRDWVAVGATPEQLLAAGYQPVGRDFPVFLHPHTREEVALARTERKSGRGYHGFTFHASADVTLEQDLARRDLTINAMARDEDGTLVDPYGGQRDLQQRVLRHVSDAFVEDPVRLLRVARFAARFHDFGIAPETMALMQRMVADGEVDALVAERVWQELSRGLMEDHPERLLRCCATPAHCSACCPRWPGCGACRNAPNTTPRSTPVRTCCWCCRPPRGPARRWRCAGPACATTWARAARRATNGRATSATKAAARGWPGNWPIACVCPPTAANWPT